MSQLMQTVNFLKKNPSVVEKLLSNEVSLLGLDETQQQAVKNAFKNDNTAEVRAWW